MKKILSDRRDSNGSRFLGIIVAFYIAKKFGVKPCFTWEHKRDRLETFSSSHIHVKDYRNFDKQRFISVFLDAKENIFSENFIQQYCLTYEDKSSLSLASCEHFYSLEEFKKYFLETDFEYYEIYPLDFQKSIKDLDIKDYIQSAAEIFNNIEFTEKVANIIKQAHLKATELTNTNGGGGINSLSYKSWRCCISFCRF